MKKSVLKLSSIFIIVVMVLTLIPTITRGAEEIKNVIILQKTSGEKVVYIEGMNSIEFKYAFSDNQNEENPPYVTALKDSNGEYVALLENGKTYKYIFIQQEEGKSTIELENAKNITEEEIKEVEALTKVIAVKTTETTSNVSKTEDGTTVTTTTGKISITDDGEYKYQMLEVVDKNNSAKTLNQTAVELYNQLSKLASAQTMYDKLLTEITIRDDYAKLVKEAKWEDAKNKEIIQPEDSQEGEKFVVLIQEVKDGKAVRTDVQFMTCARKDEADVELTNTTVTKTIEKKVALPVTGEAIALYIAFAVVILAIIILAIRIRQKGKQNEE